jgi:hypothetical protein
VDCSRACSLARGLLARLFARAHREQTAGVVLVDAMGRDQTRRQLALWPTSQAPARRRQWAEPVIDGLDLKSSEALASGIRTLGAAPLAVITAGQRDAAWTNLPHGLVRAQERLRAGCRTNWPRCPTTTCTSLRCAAAISGSAWTGSPASSSVRCSRSYTRPAATHGSRPVSTCSAAPAFAADERHGSRRHSGSRFHGYLQGVPQMAQHKANKPGWYRRRCKARCAKAERTGDTPQKTGERRPGEPISVQEAAERAGLRFGGGGGI